MAEKQFDDFMREQLGQPAEAYNPAHWDAMSDLIAKDKAAGRQKKLAWMSLGLLLLVGSAGGWYLISNQESTPAQLSEYRQEAQLIEQVTVEPNTLDKKQDDLSVPDQDLVIIDNKETASNDVATDDNTITESTVEEYGAEAEYTKPGALTDRAARLDQESIGELGSEQSAPVAAINQAADPIEEDRDLIESVESRNEISLVPNITFDQGFAKDVPSSIPANASPKEENISKSPQDLINLSIALEELAGQETTISPVAGILVKPNPVSPSAAGRKSQIDVIAGLSLYEGLGTESNGVGYFAGLRYAYPLGKRWLANANLLYAYRDQMVISKEATRESYGFGYTRQTLSLTATDFSAIELPLYIQYAASSKLRLGTGLSVGYILGGNGELNNRLENHRQVLKNESQNHKLRFSGLNSFDASVLLGAEWQVSPKWSVGLRFNYGLMDLSNNDYLDNEHSDQNHQMRFYLSKSLFK